MRKLKHKTIHFSDILTFIDKCDIMKYMNSFDIPPEQNLLDIHPRLLNFVLEGDDFAS